MRCVLLYFITILTICLPLQASAGDYFLKLNLFGVSDHFETNNAAAPYVERNYGLALSVPIQLNLVPKIETDLEIGAFRNSFDDLALWIGVGAFYPVNQYFDFGFNAYHWYTRRDTYDDRLLAVYPVLKVHLTEHVAFKTRWAQNAVVASFEITIR
jgi:hypothetical protein